VTNPHPAQEAVGAFWAARRSASARQAAKDTPDTGHRGAVTAGTHLRELENILANEFVAAGFDRSCVRRRSGVELPGYFRPTKKWDLVVMDENLLVAAIEFKSQVGPSFGNNFNNRSEEAIGSAVDVWRAYEAGTFGPVRPWLGYFFLLEEAPAATRPVRLPNTVYEVEAVFEQTSYADRYRILCQRLVRERLYDAACFMTATLDSSITEPDPEIGFAMFAAKIAGRAAEIQALKATTRID
jgi:hypothetical protein